MANLMQRESNDHLLELNYLEMLLSLIEGGMDLEHHFRCQ